MPMTHVLEKKTVIVAFVPRSHKTVSANPTISGSISTKVGVGKTPSAKTSQPLAKKKLEFVKVGKRPPLIALLQMSH